MSAPTADPVIETDQIGKRFGSRRAVADVSLQVHRGEWLTLFGGNGEGKTTLLRLISLALRPDSGGLRLWGQPSRERAGELRGRIGFLSHDLRLYPDLSCRANLEFFAEIHGCDDSAERAERALQEFGLTQRADEPVRELSRGLQQRASLARALIHDPDLVLLDEPFTGLDPTAASALDLTLADLRSRDRTCVMVTHRIDRGLESSDRWLLLRRGRVAAQGDSRGIDPKGWEREHFPPVPGSAR